MTIHSARRCAVLAGLLSFANIKKLIAPFLFSDIIINAQLALYYSILNQQSKKNKINYLRTI